MESLELKGCGVLSEASINCPLLTSLDASFCRLIFVYMPFSFKTSNGGQWCSIYNLCCWCSQLRDDCLSATTASCSKIKSLILMSCPSVGSDGLYSLSSLPHLTVLDLSYTFLTNLQPVFESCVKLMVGFYKYLASNILFSFVRTYLFIFKLSPFIVYLIFPLFLLLGVKITSM